MTIIPMRDLKNTVEVERLCNEAQCLVLVTKNGYGRLVVMDIDYYQKLMDVIGEAKVINEGLSDINNDKKVDGSFLKEKLSKKYEI